MKPRKKKNTATTKGKKTFTIKSTLSRTKPHKKLRHAINATVNDLHKVYTAGALLAQTVLYKSFSNNTLHTLPSIDQTFFNHCMTIFYSSRSKHTAITDIYQSHFHELFCLQDSTSLGQLVNEMSKQYFIAVKNHISLNFHKRMLKYWKRLCVDYNCVFEQGQKYSTLSILQSCCLDQEDSSVSDCLSAIPLPADFVAHCARTIYTWRKKYSTLLPAIWVNQVQTKLTGSTALLFLEWIMELYPDEYNDAYVSEKSKQLKQKKQSVKGLFRQFSLLPLPSLKVPHITITSSTLYELLRRTVNWGGKHPTAAQFKAKKEVWWKTLFPGIRKVIPANSSKVFCNQLRTDGVSCSIIMQDLRKNAPKKKKSGKADTYQYIPSYTHDVTRLVGIDPGRKDFYVSAEVDDITSFKKASCSTKEWTALQGAKSASNKTKRLQQKQGIRKILQRKPSGKARNYESWTQFLTYMLERLPILFKCKQSKTIRKQAFSQFRRRKRSLDSICKRISQGDRETIVGFGNGSNVSRGFGHAPAPSKELRERLKQHCKVVLIDEYLTSQICSHCHSKLKAFKRDGAEVHGIRVCPNQECRITWNRDFNAAINMHHLLFNVLNGSSRPTALRRPCGVLKTTTSLQIGCK